MRNLVLAMVLVCMAVATVSADTPTYRASWTASGVNPTVVISAEAGDSIFVVAASTGNSSTSGTFGATDSLGGSWGSLYCSSTWAVGSKWGKFDALVRTQQAASAGTMSITVNTLDKTAVVIAFAVSGISLWDPTPKINGCGSTTNPVGLTNGNVRQVKARLYCTNCNENTMVAGTVPQVPKAFQQQTAFLSTSLTISVVATQETTPSVVAPSGWTQRSTVSTSAQGKTVALNASTRDSGFSDVTVVWGSTTPTDGSAMVIEIMPLQ